MTNIIEMREKNQKDFQTKFGTKLHDRLHNNSLSSRDFLLQILPKFSIGIEIGVNEGNFSERILEIVQPKKLYLVDPWKFEAGESYTAGEIIKDQKTLDVRFQNVSKKFEKKSFYALLEKATGVDLEKMDKSEMLTVCKDNNIDIEDNYNVGQMLDGLMSTLVEPNLIAKIPANKAIHNAV